MNKKNNWLILILVIAITSLIFSGFAWAGDHIEYGRDEFGRRTETQHGGGWGDTIITYDPQTGLEIYRKWLNPDGTLRTETFTNLETGTVRHVYYFDPVTGRPNRSEETRIDPNIPREVQRIKLAREEAARAKKDNWDFLPGYEPGMVRDAENRDGDRHESSDQNSNLPLPEPMPLADPVPLAGGENPQVPQTFPASRSPYARIDTFRQEEPKEIDYSKYGDQQVIDSQGRSSVLDKKTGTVTDFQQFDGKTYATVRLDGKVVQTDVYDQLGKLISSKVLNPITQKWEDRTDAENVKEIQAPKALEPQKNSPKKMSSAFDRADALKNPMDSIFQGDHTPTAVIDAPAFATRDMGNESGMFPNTDAHKEHYDGED